MKTLVRFMFLVLIISFIGCASARKINSLSTGMTKSEVIRIMGNPVSTSATGNTEYLNYKLSETGDDVLYGRSKNYFVKLIEGKVDSYGRLGDFDSTKDPTYNINISNKP